MAYIDAEIIGALLGAIVGAFAGAWVSRYSIRYDRRLAACSAMQALADEARFNGHVAQHAREQASNYSPSAVERQAFDAALPVLHILPPPLGERCRDARAKILILMHLEEVLESALTKPGRPPAAMIEKRDELMATLPGEFDRLADDLERFVMTDCQSRWSGLRSSSHR